MSLRRRLIIALFLLLVGIGAAIAAVGQYAARLYFQEINQTLNSSIAMYVVERLNLIEDGSVNNDNLMVLAERAMTINPSVEVYLLDPTGLVLSHGMPTGSIVSERVDVAPIQRFLSGGHEFPVLGTDPRSSDSHKAFSVAPIMHNNQMQGYLYVVLGGQHFDAVQASFMGSFIGRVAAGGLVAVLIIGGVLGALILRQTVKPLEDLEREVRRYTDSKFTAHNLTEVTEATSEVTSLKQELTVMAAALESQFEQIQTNDNLRRELFSNVSHDLRTPLATMQGYLETLLIKDQRLAVSERREYLATAHKQAKHLNKLVGDLFQLAKLDNNAIALNVEPFLLAELLQDVAQEFAISAEQKGITLILNNNPSIANSLVQGDIGLMQRVLENLISNALRHTPAGGRVELGLESAQDNLEVSVSDTGSGIDAQLLPHIFDRYASGSGSPDLGHTGLGLAIVKRILDLHDSRIVVQSKPEEGTHFSFSLRPLALAA